jgi:hypothetical protein
MGTRTAPWGKRMSSSVESARVWVKRERRGSASLDASSNRRSAVRVGTNGARMRCGFGCGCACACVAERSLEEEGDDMNLRRARQYSPRLSPGRSLHFFFIPLSLDGDYIKCNHGSLYLQIDS